MRNKNTYKSNLVCNKDLSKRETVRHNVVPGVAGVGVAQVGNGEGEGRADQVEGVHHSKG